MSSFKPKMYNSKALGFWVRLGGVSWIILFLYFIFVYGGFHPNENMVQFLGMYCWFLIILFNVASIWKVIAEFVRFGNIELVLIIKTSVHILIPLYFI